MERGLWWWFAAGAVLAAVPGSSALSPAEQAITMAERAIADGNASAETYNRLALAFTHRARETADPAYYVRAQKALEESFRLAPDNFEARKTEVWTLLGQHEFAAALRGATALQRRAPDDLMVYAMLVDANVELGNYADAEAAAQWLLDLRPGNVPGLTRAAYLRELFGDVEGAIELMTQAYERTPPAEVGERAWLLTHLARLQRLGGRPTTSEALLFLALQLFPDYHYALGELAELRTEQKRHAEAVTLLEKRFAAAPHPENQYALAEALWRDGRHRSAEAAYREFEEKARAESTRADNANRELIFYELERANRPREALRLAELEMQRRPNLQIREAYACALLANGRREEAQQEFKKALAVGAREPGLVEHARSAGLVVAAAE